MPVSRRTFAMSAGVVTCCGALLLAACGGTSAPSAGAGNSTPGTAATKAAHGLAGAQASPSVPATSKAPVSSKAGSTTGSSTTAKPEAGHPTSTVPKPGRAKSAPATFMGPDGVEARWVIAENAKPGTADWHLSGTKGPSINGFADMVAASEGQQVKLYITTAAPHYHVSAYRIGYYGGKGGRLVWRSPELRGVVQPACTLAPATRMVACDNWSASLSVDIGPQFVQGDYLFKLVADPGQQSYIPLTVWDPSSHSAYLVQNSVLTWQGWNNWGGYDMYGGAPPGRPPQYAQRAYVESFDRPYANGNGAADFMALEFPLVFWAEQHGLDVSYWTDVTFSQHPQILAQHRALLTLGHDETWTANERNGVVAARSEGVNVIYFGASPVLRHARLQSSPLGPDREEV
ncbi:MAG TPA: N,N-dimethylformamidase beta subunit family domain-containing protein, partial [Acidimicrobiales bacterium]|nr:N,N-dimethylformamidase beta subunit family domain-containing protein [Acidimicrobiales bacterium]